MTTDINSDVQSAHENILKLLNDAGADGLHIDDILYLLGFNSKKELIPRLKELKYKRAIFEIEGGRWKKNTDTATMNGANGEPTETFISPACKEDLPSVYLPGSEKFSSYKNTLQEFCQKKKYSVPEYKALRESNGLVGTVSFALNFVRSTEIAGSVKEADARVAFEALRLLGYDLKEENFTVHNQCRSAPATKDDIQVSKKVKSGIQGHITFKMLLNEYAQRKKLQCPIYETVASNNSFFSTVTLDGKKYKGLADFKRQKDAEQNAAQVALTDLVGVVPEELKRKDTSANNDASKVAKLMGNGAKDPISCKSRLNEYAQKKQIDFAKYETVPVNGGFFSTVYFNGESFKSMCTCKKRKESEQNAAQVALNALIGTPLPTVDEPMALGEADVTKMVSEARQAAQPVALKNRLQEYCQRMGKTLPVYDTKHNETDKTYQSTVDVQGVTFTGTALKGKKNAETSAAEAALKSLELMA